MRHSPSPRRTMTAAAMVSLLAVWTATGHTQLNQDSISKAVVREAGPPAIDRGLRDQDPPRPPRTKETTSHARAASADGLPYLRGSIIVKFKDDASRSAMTAATVQVAGDIHDRSSNADFDIVDI